jgi:hypothetical protein
MHPSAPAPLLVLARIHRVLAAVRRALDDARPVAEARLEEHVRVREQALLEADDDELAALEARAEELPDVLRVREVERGVDLVEDVHRRGLELQERQDQRQRDERPARPSA